MWLLLLVFIVIPIVEIGLFIAVGGWLGLWPTLGLIVLTAVIGTLLVRHQGFATLDEARRRIDNDEDPSELMMQGVVVLLAGLALLTPGFFTDAVGFVLLVPRVRRFFAGRFDRHAAVAGMAKIRRGRTGGGGRTIDGEWEEVDPDATARPPVGSRPSGWTRDP